MEGKTNFIKLENVPNMDTMPMIDKEEQVEWWKTERVEWEKETKGKEENLKS